MVLAVILAFGTPDFSAYPSWTCITPTAVDMAPAIAFSCIGPSSWTIDKTNPHTPKRFKVWVNPMGLATMRKPMWREIRPGESESVTTRFPAGSVIVKEKFDASVGVEGAIHWQRKTKPLPAKPELLTIMVKGPKGSKTKTGDWSYYVSDGALKMLDSSQEAKCASCHASQPERDFTFRDYDVRGRKR